MLITYNTQSCLVTNKELIMQVCMILKFSNPFIYVAVKLLPDIFQLSLSFCFIFTNIRNSVIVNIYDVHNYCCAFKMAEE